MRSTKHKTMQFASLVAGVILTAWLAVLPCAAQQVSINGAVIQVSPGTYISTDGSITIEEEGVVDNHGTIEAGGDWINNGKGLCGGRGTVILTGDSPVIGGENATAFHNLILKGEGDATLAADISISGVFDFSEGNFFTGGFALSFLQLIPQAFTACGEAADPLPEAADLCPSFSPPVHGNSTGVNLHMSAGVSGGTSTGTGFKVKPGKSHSASLSTVVSMLRCASHEAMPEGRSRMHRNASEANLSTIYFSSAVSDDHYATTMQEDLPSAGIMTLNEMTRSDRSEIQSPRFSFITFSMKGDAQYV